MTTLLENFTGREEKMFDEFNRYIPLLLGIVFDCSERQTNGIKNITLLKNALGEVLNTDCLEPEDRVYFFEPEIEVIPERKGGTIQRLLSYKPSLVELDMAIEQTILLLACEPEDFRRYVIVITDKYGAKDEIPCKQIFNLNEAKFGVNLMLFGFGKCDKSIKTLKNQVDVTFLEDVTDLKDILVNFVRKQTGKVDAKIKQLSQDETKQQSSEE